MGSRVRLDLNPHFTFLSPSPGTAIDRKQLADHVDHAIIALDGRAPLAGDCCLEQLGSTPTDRPLRVELWVDDLDDYTCTYGFTVSSEDGCVPYARGERTVVSIDPASKTPARWSSDFRRTHAELLRDLPAYG